MSQKQRKPLSRRSKRILFASGFATIGIATALAQTDISQQVLPMVGIGEPQQTVEQSDLPGQPVNGFNKPKESKFQDENVDQSRDEEFVDPREVKNLLNEMKNQRREIQRVLKEFKKAKSAGAEIREIEAVLAQLTQFEKNIKAAQKSETGMRDAMQDYYDAQLWDTVNEARRKVQLPREISQIAKELKKLEGMLKGKTFQQQLPLDKSALDQNVNVVREALNQAKASYEAGDLEEAEQALQEIHEGKHPGEIMGVLYRLRDLSRMTRQIKDADILDAINEILDPVIESANSGDFREANMILNDYFNDIMKVVQMSTRLGRTKEVHKDKIEALLERLGQKMDDRSTKDKTEASSPQETAPRSQPTESAGNEPG